MTFGIPYNKTEPDSVYSQDLPNTMEPSAEHSKLSDNVKLPTLSSLKSKSKHNRSGSSTIAAQVYLDDAAERQKSPPSITVTQKVFKKKKTVEFN